MLCIVSTFVWVGRRADKDFWANSITVLVWRGVTSVERELPGSGLTGEMAEKRTGLFRCLSPMCLPHRNCRRRKLPQAAEHISGKTSRHKRTTKVRFSRIKQTAQQLTAAQILTVFSPVASRIREDYIQLYADVFFNRDAHQRGFFFKFIPQIMTVPWNIPHPARCLSYYRQSNSVRC